MKIFAPTYWLNSVLEIDAEFLNKAKIRGLILDMDNTLSMHNSITEESGVSEWVERMRLMGVRMVVVSNNYRPRVEPLARRLGLDFYCAGLKPLSLGLIKGRRFLKLKKEHTAVVGDQIFTDILGGNLYGIRTILVEPFHLEDKISFKVKRKIEQLMWKRDFDNIKKYKE